MLGASYECSHCKSKYLHRRADRLVRCEECETIVEESLTQPIPYVHHKETTELLQLVTPMHLSIEQRTDLAKRGLPSGFVAVYSVVETDPYTLFLGMPGSIPADVLDLERRFSSLNTSEPPPKAQPQPPAAPTQSSSSQSSSQPSTQPPTQPIMPLAPSQSPAKVEKPKGNTVLYKNLLIGFYMIQKIAQAFQVKHQIFDDAFHMFRIALEHVQTKKVEEMAAGAMRLAMDRHNEVKPFPTFCAATGNLTAPQVHEGAKTIRKFVPSHLLEKAGAPTAADQTRMLTQIDILSQDLKLSAETKEKAALFVQRVVDSSLTTRKHPRSVPAACVYLACEWTQEKRSQSEVSRAASIAEGTLRIIVAELRSKLLSYAKALQPESLALNSNSLDASGESIVPGEATAAAKSSDGNSNVSRASGAVPRSGNASQQSIKSFFSPIKPLLPPTASSSSSSSASAKRSLFPTPEVQSHQQEVPQGHEFSSSSWYTALGSNHPQDGNDDDDEDKMDFSSQPIPVTQESDNNSREATATQDLHSPSDQPTPKRRKLNDNIGDDDALNRGD